MTSTRPLASISLDVDDLWSYLKTHGDPAWASRPSYLDRFVPRALEALAAVGTRCTFFLVGVDAARLAGTGTFRAIVDAGHTVGCHSHEHEPWLHLYTDEQLDRELAQAESAIDAATGRRPIGFRGPGFSWSPALIARLADRGYRYDASTLPTFLGPLARAYYFATARMTREEREQRKALFGSFREGFRPIRPYRWNAGGRTLLEIPVTTIPLLRTPFHLSYLLYLSRWSEALMTLYLRTAITACRAARVEPSFLLHPLDLLGGDEVPELAFFPGMDITGERKTRLFRKVLGILGEHFELVDLDSHAAALEARTLLPAPRSPIPNP
ncbi:MAG: polysaccharide deacetylase family protein [Gemmatimonadales bacterium]